MKSKLPTAPKPPSRMGFAGRLESVSQMPAPNHMNGETLAPMNFKVAPDFHRAFKTAAVTHGISMRDLLEQSFELWLEKNKGA